LRKRLRGYLQTFVIKNRRLSSQ